MIRPSAEKNSIELIEQITEDDKLAVNADYARLHQVLITFLYNGSNGKVTLSFRSQGEITRISMTDNGQGSILGGAACHCGY